MDAEPPGDPVSTEDPAVDGPDATAGPSAPPPPEAPRAEDPGDARLESNRRMRAATVLTIPALLAVAASAALFLLPVTNPGVQDCGSPAWFLLQAHTDRPLVTDEGSPLHGWDKARLRQAHDDRCSAQVADRAVPAGVLLLVFWVLALVAIVVGWTGRRSLRRQSMVDRR